MRGNIIKKRKMSSAFKKTSCISLSFKLVPVQCREHEHGLLNTIPAQLLLRAFSSFAKIGVLVFHQRVAPKCDSEKSSNLPSYQCSEKTQGRTASGIGGQRRISPQVALWET